MKRCAGSLKIRAMPLYVVIASNRSMRWVVVVGDEDEDWAIRWRAHETEPDVILVLTWGWPASSSPGSRALNSPRLPHPCVNGFPGIPPNAVANSFFSLGSLPVDRGDTEAACIWGCLGGLLLSLRRLSRPVG